MNDCKFKTKSRYCNGIQLKKLKCWGGFFFSFCISNASKSAQIRKLSILRIEDVDWRPIKNTCDVIKTEASVLGHGNRNVYSIDTFASLVTSLIDHVYGFLLNP